MDMIPASVNNLSFYREIPRAMFQTGSPVVWRSGEGYRHGGVVLSYSLPSTLLLLSDMTSCGVLSGGQPVDVHVDNTVHSIVSGCLVSIPPEAFDLFYSNSFSLLKRALTSVSTVCKVSEMYPLQTHTLICKTNTHTHKMHNTSISISIFCMCVC